MSALSQSGNPYHIEIFHAVMTAGSLTEAAHLLHTSQ
ncbi:hypothetical protein ACUODJ_27340, partial [Escherichia sp. HC-CC]